VQVPILLRLSLAVDHTKIWKRCLLYLDEGDFDDSDESTGLGADRNEKMAVSYEDLGFGFGAPPMMSGLNLR